MKTVTRVRRYLRRHGGGSSSRFPHEPIEEFHSFEETVLRYIKNIKNREQRDYALFYYYWLKRGAFGREPSTFGLPESEANPIRKKLHKIVVHGEDVAHLHQSRDAWLGCSDCQSRRIAEGEQ